MTEQLLATVATETASYQAGWYGGAIVLGALVILGIIKCIKTVADERGNTKCALSLGLALVSIGATSVCGAMMRAGSLNGPLGRYLVLFCFAMLAAALVLAIWGIIEFGRSDSYDHGMGLGITTIVLFGFIGVIAVPNFLRARAVAHARAKSSADSASTSNAAPASVAYREYGFSFQPPSKPWAEYNAKKLNPEATIGFMRARPTVFFMVIAENEHADGLTLDAVLEVVKARMNSQATSVRVVKETVVSRAGIRGMQLETQARLDGASVHFIQWVGLHKSYLYQLCCWGEQRDREKVQAESEEMFNRFQVLDGAPWAGMQEVKPQYAGAKPPRGDKYYRSERFHYAVDLSQSDWKQWGTEGRLRRDADFGATHPSGAHFSLIPVSLLNQRPPQEALRRAFAVAAGLKQLQMKERQSVMQKHFHGAEYETHSKQAAGVHTHRIRVIEGKDYAYMIEVWAPKDSPQLESIWADMLDRTDILVPLEKVPDSQQWTERDKNFHARFFTALASAYSQPTQVEKSNSCLRIAAEFGPTQTAKAIK